VDIPFASVDQALQKIAELRASLGSLVSLTKDAKSKSALAKTIGFPERETSN